MLPPAPPKFYHFQRFFNLQYQTLKFPSGPVSVCIRSLHIHLRGCHEGSAGVESAVCTFYPIFQSVRDEIFKCSMCSFSQPLLFLSSEIPEPNSSSAGALRKQMLLRGCEVVNDADGVPLLSAKGRTVPGCHWK